MINFIPSWLFVTLPTVIHATPVVGWFIHYAKDYHMYFTVDEKQKAHTFVFNAYTRVTDNVYSIGFSPDVLRKWYTNIADSLYITGHVDSKDGFPPAGIQPGDLVTITQTSGDTYTTNFRGETIKLMRRSSDLEYLNPGLFEYEEPVAPHLKLSVYVRYDETRRGVVRGSVGILVSCDGRPTSRFHFKLVPYENGKPYERYNVESAGRGTFDQFIRMVRYVCPTKHLKPVDFTNVVIASDRRIYVPFEVGRMALTRVK